MEVGQRGRGRGGAQWKRREELPLGRHEPRGKRDEDVTTINGIGAEDFPDLGDTRHDEPPESLQLDARPGLSPVDEAECDEDEVRSRILEQIKSLEQQVVRRKQANARRSDEIQRMRAEITNNLCGEEHALNEAGLARAQAVDSDDAIQHGRLEMEQRLQECMKKEACNHKKEKEWHEELDSMSRQNAAVAEEVDELEKEVQLLQRTSEEDKKQVSRAETRLKALEAQRAEFRSQGERLVQQSAEHRKSAEEALAAIKKAQSGQTHSIAAEIPHLALWQGCAGFLTLLLIWLLWLCRSTSRATLR